MSFLHPWYLTFLIVPLFLGFWLFFRESNAVTLPFDGVKSALGSRITGFFIRLLELVTPLMLAVAIFLLAEPVREGPPQHEKVMTNIILCVDLSGSMGIEFDKSLAKKRSPRSVTIGGMTTYEFGEDGTYTRYHAAIDAIDFFSSQRKGDAFGLTFFGSEYLHWLPVTQDINALQTCAKLLNPNTMPRWFGGTRICNALRGCITRMSEQKEGDRMIIVITDGESQDFENGQDIQVAHELKEANIVTYFVSINPNMLTESLSLIAGITTGEALVADDLKSLKRIFTHIDQMNKTKIKQRDKQQVTQYAPFAAGGIILGFFALIYALGMRYTPW